MLLLLLLCIMDAYASPVCYAVPAKFPARFAHGSVRVCEQLSSFYVFRRHYSGEKDLVAVTAQQCDEDDDVDSCILMDSRSWERLAVVFAHHGWGAFMDSKRSFFAGKFDQCINLRRGGSFFIGCDEGRMEFTSFVAGGCRPAPSVGEFHRISNSSRITVSPRKCGSTQPFFDTVCEIRMHGRCAALRTSHSISCVLGSTRIDEPIVSADRLLALVMKYQSICTNHPPPLPGDWVGFAPPPDSSGAARFQRSTDAMQSDVCLVNQHQSRRIMSSDGKVTLQYWPSLDCTGEPDMIRTAPLVTSKECTRELRECGFGRNNTKIEREKLPTLTH